MNIFLTFAFLFFIGSVSGWVIELFYRRFISASNPKRKWVNPGFCTGPYLPLYGCGLCLLYLITMLEDLNFTKNPIYNKAILFIVMAICMTVIEYIAGIISLKVAKVRLWDYTNQWGNIQGIICPKFSFFWAVLGAIYYFFIHPHIHNALQWLSQNLAFSFFIGLFFGVFIIDVAHSAQLTSKLKKYAEENNVIIRYEAFKADIRKKYELSKQKYHFFLPLKTLVPISEHLKNLRESFEQKKKLK